MAYVYILFSRKLNKYYVGSCLNLSERLEQHKNGVFANSYTKKADDWEVFFDIPDLTYAQARKIERHIKRMKSKRYIENLKRYPEIVQRLKVMYG